MSIRTSLFAHKTRTGAVIVAGALVAPLAFAAPAAYAAAPDVSLTITRADGSAVTEADPLEKVILGTSMPSSPLEVKLTQEIVTTIDPAKLQITGPADVVAPKGWSVTYSEDGTTFTTSPTSWAAVQKVKGSGTMRSEGATADGQQISTGDETIPTPPVLSTPASASGGDGYNVTFDNRGYLFNMYHHDAPKAIDCHNRSDGQQCTGSWPFNVGTYGFHSNANSVTYVDNINHHVWFPTNNATSMGLGCVDVTDISKPQLCGGSVETGYHALGTPGSSSHSAAGQIFADVENLYSMNTSTGRLMCLNFLANAGLGGPCKVAPPALSAMPAAWLQDAAYHFASWNGQVYVFHHASGTLACFASMTMQKCANWTGFEQNVGTGANSVGKGGWARGGMYFPPDENGDIRGVCFVWQKKCMGADGVAVAAWDTALADAIDMQSYATSVTTGTKVIWMSDQFAYARCWDVVTDAYCANWGTGINHSSFKYGGYTVNLDPENDNCVWTNSDDGKIRSYDVTTATLGCSTPPAKVVFSSDLIPVHTCSGIDAIKDWRKFKLTGIPETGYTNAYLTIKKANGVVLTSNGTTWSRVLIPKDGVRELDLTSISNQDSGIDPEFIVTFTGRSVTDDVGAQVTVSGGAPQMCVSATVQPNCPTFTGPAFVKSGWAGTFGTMGSVLPEGQSATDLGPVTKSMTAAAPTIPQCGAPIKGTVTDKSGNGQPIKGLTVTLLDSSGAVVKYPAGYANAALRGKAVTAVTDNAGKYTFPILFADDYTVKFADGDSLTVVDNKVVSGAPGSVLETTDATDGVAISTVASVFRFIPAVVDARYIAAAVGADDNVTGSFGEPLDVRLLDNDQPGSGQFLQPTSLFLCPAKATTFKPSVCTLRPDAAHPLVTADGTYTFQPGTFSLRFVPRAGFSGKLKEPLHYVAQDSAGALVTAKVNISISPQGSSTGGSQPSPLPKTGAGSPLLPGVAAVLMLVAGLALRLRRRELSL